MPQITYLYALIKSMSKTEKRYFKMTTRFKEGDKVFMALFDIMDSAQSGGET